MAALIPFVCQSASNPDGSQGALTDDYISLQCWSGIHSLLFFLGIVQLTMLVATKLLFTFYMHDSYYDCGLPWSQYSMEPELLRDLVMVIYSAWYVLDVNR